MTRVSAAAAVSSGAPLSPTAHRVHGSPGTTHLLPPLEENRHLVRVKQLCWTAWIVLTSSWDISGETEVSDAPLLAHCSPGRVAWPLVLHHQGEAAPWEVWAHVLLTSHHAQAVLYPEWVDNSNVLLPWQPRHKIGENRKQMRLSLLQMPKYCLNVEVMYWEWVTDKVKL